jgi:hypothetical protein
MVGVTDEGWKGGWSVEWVEVGDGERRYIRCT